VERRNDDKKATESDEDYGFYNPFDVVERCYWERANSEGKVYPDPGGMLDQDEHLMTDLRTYGWLVGFAQNIYDKDAAIKAAIKDALKRRTA
jgi:hypothetical protein